MLSKTNIDTITDFSTGVDVISLDAEVFKTLLGRTDLSNNFENIITGSKASSPNHYLLYNISTGGLYYDEDGSGEKITTLIGTFENGAGPGQAHINLQF
jgi:Ca2+-binding RTX toxin-like protein